MFASVRYLDNAESVPPNTVLHLSSSYSYSLIPTIHEPFVTSHSGGLFGSLNSALGRLKDPNLTAHMLVTTCSRTLFSVINRKAAGWQGMRRQGSTPWRVPPFVGSN